MLKLARYLDVRPADASKASPIIDAVNIPFDQLGERSHELPKSSEAVRVADTGEEARTAIAHLVSMQRAAGLAQDFAFGPNECGLRLWQPNSFLESVVQNLAPGRALDLGCGTGRDAVYLASLGWQVMAVDWLPDALERAASLELAHKNELEIPVRWERADIEADGYVPDGEFDLIATFFLLDRTLLRRTPAWLRPGGSLIVETFTREHRARFGRPREVYTLELQELNVLLPELVVRHYEEALHGDRHTARYLGTKPVN